MSEKNVKKFYETIARIISDREQIKVSVTVSRRQEEKIKEGGREDCQQSF